MKFGDAGARMAAFSCIGRLETPATDAFSGKKGPCNYAGGGLFQLNPIYVEYPADPRLSLGPRTVRHFGFADDPLAVGSVPKELKA